MRSYPSRTEKREIQLYTVAEKGELSINEMVLYASEITKLEKQGFKVLEIKPYTSLKKLFTATVDWSQAYGITIPPIVYSYTHGVIDTFPKNSVKNLAQELYVIAHRAKKKK